MKRTGTYLGASVRATALIADVLKGSEPFQFVDESQLQEAIFAALSHSFASVTREGQLKGGLGRIDFLVQVGDMFQVGVELKVKGSPASVARQLLRYAGCEQLDGLVLVSTHAQHAHVTTLLQDCPVPIGFVLLQGGAL